MRSTQTFLPLIATEKMAALEQSASTKSFHGNTDDRLLGSKLVIFCNLMTDSSLVKHSNRFHLRLFSINCLISPLIRPLPPDTPKESNQTLPKIFVSANLSDKFSVLPFLSLFTCACIYIQLITVTDNQIQHHKTLWLWRPFQLGTPCTPSFALCPDQRF